MQALRLAHISCGIISPLRLILAFAVLAALTPAAAHDYQAGAIQIEHPWTRATPAGAQVGGGYLTVTNRGTAPDRLIGGSVSAARDVRIHDMTMDGGVMKMRPVSGGVEIPPGATVELGPESVHLMFEGLQKPLTEGQRIKGTLIFEKSGTVDIEYAVEGIGAKKSPAPATPPHDHKSQ